MNKIVLAFVCLCFCATSYSQFTLTLQVPQSGILLKPQLWSGIITNSYPDSKQIFLGLTLSDVSNGEPIFTATTSKFYMATGALQFMESNLSPISYDYLSSDITDRNPQGYLPAGTYNVCYTVFLIDENSGIPLVEECTPVIVEPVSPPILNIPFDKQVIHNPYPQFSWIPPTPLEIFSNLNYDFVLVEVQNEQSEADAIEQNLPLYTANVNDLYLNYPASSQKLDTGKIYAWQITAKNNGEYAAKSEVWTFSLSDTTLKTPYENFNGFTKLKRTLDASISSVAERLLVYYENDAEDSLIQYNIYDINENPQNIGSLKLITAGEIKLKPGVNLISIPLEQIHDIANNKLYMYQMHNSRDENWSMKFIYYKKD